jgi:hypothetical protein
VGRLGPISKLTCVLFVVTSAACSSPVQGASDERAQESFRVAVCEAILGLADNQKDFDVFLHGTSRDDAAAALNRVRQRTAVAADRLDAAGDEWPRGTDAAKRLAATQRSLLPILADLDDVVSRGDMTKWAPATHAYTGWYNSTASVVRDLAPALTTFGISQSGC